MDAAPAQLFYVDDPRFEDHVSVGDHPERPDRLRAIRSGLIQPLRDHGAQRVLSREVEDAELLRVHAPEYLTALERAFQAGRGQLDADTFFSSGSRMAARLAAGSAVELVRKLSLAPSAASVLAMRPPGHHATRTRAMGFCILNSVAVAAGAALSQGLERVAIVDWDVHHGNGTQAIFEDDPRVLFVSVHQWPLYPGTGRSEEIGVGAGRGRTVNVPLPAGSRSQDYGAAMRRVVLPVLEQFRPELVLVSCGFDAHADDPLAGMQLRDEDYGALTRSLWQSSVRAGCSRLGLVLEGGYDLGALERAGEQVALALLGRAHELEESGPSGAAQRAIDATRRALAAHWEL